MDISNAHLSCPPLLSAFPGAVQDDTKGNKGGERRRQLRGGGERGSGCSRVWGDVSSQGQATAAAAAAAAATAAVAAAAAAAAAKGLCC